MFFGVCAVVFNDTNHQHIQINNNCGNPKPPALHRCGRCQNTLTLPDKITLLCLPINLRCKYNQNLSLSLAPATFPLPQTHRHSPPAHHLPLDSPCFHNHPAAQPSTHLFTHLLTALRLPDSLPLLSSEL